ncbi:hypothetical protein PR202_ga11887 [Eleusine coracana subsp. coracana]|uniref:Uncharacterized protein n=1 Tax=Eleusine coracana subsp. coracana TaxID=191504 RepID=A0AAV5CAN9_ELECO|nr:hypothetical protein PR202_ga11887 [Eleusine coracana subsp. coracana]
MCGSMVSTHIPGGHANITRFQERGGANRLKHHLAYRDGNVVQCGRVPPDVRDYYRRELAYRDGRVPPDVERKKEKQRDNLRREEVVREGNVVHEISDDEVLQRVLDMSQEEEAYARRVRNQGGQYEHGGGSSQSQGGGGGLLGMLRRSMSVTKEKVQTRIDIGQWTTKCKAGKNAIDKVWSKFFHIEGISDRKADNPYFQVVVKETQRWDELIF